MVWCVSNVVVLSLSALGGDDRYAHESPEGNFREESVFRLSYVFLAIICLISNAGGQSAVVTRALVDGYVMDIPKMFEIKSAQYLQDRDAPRNRAGDAGRYLLVAGSWREGFQFAYIGVRIQNNWDKLYESYDHATTESFRELQRKMMEDLKPSLDQAGAKVIEQLEPQFSVSSSKDKIVLLRYRRQDKNTTTSVGQLMVFRPKNSFSVTFSYDEQVGGDLVNRAVLSVRRQ
jgi:hypothetical protein